MVWKYINNINRIYSPDRHIMEEIVKTNINRLFYLILISIPIRVLTIISLLHKTTVSNDKEAIWKTGIIICHIVHLFILIILGGFSLKLRNKKSSVLMLIILYTMIITMLFITIAITSIDQLITYNITPFLMSCIAIGILFLIKPLHSILIFATGYIVYYFAMGITQVDSSVLLSNRIT